MSHENEAAAEPHVSGSRRGLGSLFTEAVRRHSYAPPFCDLTSNANTYQGHLSSTHEDSVAGVCPTAGVQGGLPGS